MTVIEIILTVFASVMASSGLWAFIQKKSDKKSALHKMCLGLGHDRIIHLGKQYIDRGYITTDEYENLVKYLYEPYAAMGGNGTAKKIVDEINKLPIKN